jgi:hypothetical protein
MGHPTSETAFSFHIRAEITPDAERKKGWSKSKRETRINNQSTFGIVSTQKRRLKDVTSF